MRIFTSAGYTDGMCLISTGDFVGLVIIEFLPQECSLSEYIKWYGSEVKGVVPLSDVSMGLQNIHISSIEQLCDITSIAQDELDKTSLKEEDVLIPLIGGIIGYNFKTFLNKLWSVESRDYYDYVREIRNYYKELFKSHEESK